MLRCVRFFCCSRIPRSTPTDYYFDPRVVTIGPKRFSPEKTQNLVSEEEYKKMREEIITSGGSNLKTAKILYFALIIFALITFAWWVVRIVLAATGSYHFSKAAIIISIVLTIVVNILLNRAWAVFMKKGAVDVQQMFERQNQAVYGSKGITWSTCQTLVFVRIQISSNKARVQGIPLNSVMPQQKKETADEC